MTVADTLLRYSPQQAQTARAERMMCAPRRTLEYLVHSGIVAKTRAADYRGMTTSCITSGVSACFFRAMLYFTVQQHTYRLASYS